MRLTTVVSEDTPTAPEPPGQQSPKKAPDATANPRPQHRPFLPRIHHAPVDYTTIVTTFLSARGSLFEWTDSMWGPPAKPAWGVRLLGRPSSQNALLVVLTRRLFQCKERKQAEGPAEQEPTPGDLQPKHVWRNMFSRKSKWRMFRLSGRKWDRSGFSRNA